MFIFCSLNDLHYLQGDIFGAGMDTTQTSLKFTLLYLCKYPDWQSKLRQKMQGEILLESLPNMACLQAFISEVQRLHPVVPLGVPHANKTDLKINKSLEFKPVSSWTDYLPSKSWSILPKGSMVMCLHWYINRDPDNWKNPLEFNPARFLQQGHDGQQVYVPPSNLMPFQVGRRRCIGEDFAKTILGYFVANLVKNFDLELESGYDLEVIHEHGFTLNPNPFKLRLIGRDGL